MQSEFDSSVPSNESTVRLNDDNVAPTHWQQQETKIGESLFGFVKRLSGHIDQRICGQILGSANPFKEGDESLGLAANNEDTRQRARELIRNTTRREIDNQPVHRDQVLEFIQQTTYHGTPTQVDIGETIGDLQQFLLTADQSEIQHTLCYLSSDVIGCVVKLMNNDQLIQVSNKVFNPLPQSRIGDKGFLGARVQPNSPTDHPEDIFWQVMDAWAYGVGDVLLGTNPVSSDPKSVAAVQNVLQDLLKTFELTDVLPHCVLAHIDVQAEVEARYPGSTELWFQSIAGTDSANKTFDLSVEKLKQYADQRTERYGFYFETGQGADFTNGHGLGFDMVLHESRKYGLVRGLAQQASGARRSAGLEERPWIHVNDVAGFIGPEVFRTREQLVRCCLEDIVMGKLHGLCIGLDVCSTLHMDISLDDLDWCLEQIMPANPAYLMSLPTKIDPMLGYLTTGYQDHIRLRQSFGYQINPPMKAFFNSLEVLQSDDQPGKSFGDPLAIYVQYRKRKGDKRDEQQIRDEGKRSISDVRKRGVFLAEGYGNKHWELQPKLNERIHHICNDAKESLWAELDSNFLESFPNATQLNSLSEHRQQYILQPTTGEKLSDVSKLIVQELTKPQPWQTDVQVVVSDGLNALSIMQDGHLGPFLDTFHGAIQATEIRVSKNPLLVALGRVRIGYEIGEILFQNTTGPRAILHLIGERPGTGHRTFSAYLTTVDGTVWSKNGTVDHQHTKVISGIAKTALQPTLAAQQVTELLKTNFTRLG